MLTLGTREGAVVGTIDDPMEGLRAQNMRREPAGRTLADVAPITDKPVLCQLAGTPGYISREQWGYPLQDNDIVVFFIDPPQGREDIRTLLQVASVVASIWFPAASPYLTAATIAYNVLVPPVGPQALQGLASNSVYSTSLQGNQARLDEPIWKICGRFKISPPFAAEPYLEFVDLDGDDLDNKQYYYALLAVGVGNHDIEKVLIGGTSITHYSDVLVNQYLAPGVQPSTTLANVSTATAVAGNVLDSGKYVGGFAACRPQRTCTAIGLDIVATRGLAKGTGALSVSWRVEARTINDFGVATTSWATIGTGSKTAATNTPQRWSQKITLGTPARVEIRVVRTDAKDPDSTALHELAWAGLRAYLAQPAPLNANTAHYEVVLRASDQLSQLSQRDITVITTAKCRTWSPGGGWAAEVATRNPAWWLADLATNAAWGLGEPDARVDLQSIYDYAALCETRQDRFDYCFDRAMGAWDAMQLIARSMRARVFRRANGVISVARDELVSLPITAFTHRICQPGSMLINERLPTREQPDGYVVEYLDNRTWLWTSLDCPCPGVGTMANPIRKRYEGITGPTHAKREGLYDAADLLYRTRTALCKTEMQGVLPTYMSACKWLPRIAGYGQAGDVAYWDAPTLVMGLSEPPAWGAADLYLTLVRDVGTLTTAVKVTAGPTAYDVVLPAAPDFTLVLDDGTRERPKYLLGPLADGDELVKVLAIKPAGKGSEGEQLYDITAVVDDARVHAADAAYLPSGGVVQDPILSGEDADSGGGNLYLTNLTSRRVYAGGAGTTVSAEFKLLATGHAQYKLTGVTTDIPTEWMQFGDVELAVAALYEVRATLILPVQNTGNNSAANTLSGSALNVWAALSADFVLTLTSTGGGTFGGAPRTGAYAYLAVEIRLVGTTTVLSSANIRLETFSQYT